MATNRNSFAGLQHANANAGANSASDQTLPFFSVFCE